MKYTLSPRQEDKFRDFYNKYQDKIKLAVYKCNISANNYNHFYSHALEGFLQSFLIMEAGEIEVEDFPAFVYINMKRKIIDELRRFSRNTDIAINREETFLCIGSQDNIIEEFILKESLIKILDKREEKIFNYLEKGYSYKDISSLENISKSTYYNIVSSIKSKSIDLLYK